MYFSYYIFINYAKSSNLRTFQQNPRSPCHWSNQPRNVTSYLFRTKKIATALTKTRLAPIEIITVPINSGGGSLIQANNISDLLRNYSEKKKYIYNKVVSQFIALLKISVWVQPMWFWYQELNHLRALWVWWEDLSHIGGT